VEDRHGQRGYVPHTYLKLYPTPPGPVSASTTGNAENEPSKPKDEGSEQSTTVEQQSQKEESVEKEDKNVLKTE